MKCEHLHECVKFLKITDTRVHKLYQCCFRNTSEVVNWIKVSFVSYSLIIIKYLSKLLRELLFVPEESSNERGSESCILLGFLALNVLNAFGRKLQNTHRFYWYGGNHSIILTGLAVIQFETAPHYTNWRRFEKGIPYGIIAQCRSVHKRMTSLIHYT